MLCAIDGITGTKSILRDVAAVAGVSLRTASRVLNDDPRVAVATRARVQQAMRDLRYTPDSMARSLRAGTDTAVGMVVESVADPFFSAMVAAVEQAASGRSVLVASTRGDPARERDVVAQMLSRRVAGLLLAPATGDHGWLQTATPLVLVDRGAPGLDADVVAIDDEGACAEAVDHLVAHGHRRIAYIGDHPLVPTSRARLDGYRRAMATHGLDVNPRLVHAECPDAAAAAAATRDLLATNDSDGPTAVVSAATRCSLGVVPTLHALGRTDTALVCFGDFAMAELLQPGVTVVDHSADAVGAAAAARLAERIANPDLPPATIHVSVHLIPRGSGELRP
jgi:LacI family transcriptional regulator, galactose operon repressor